MKTVTIDGKQYAINPTRTTCLRVLLSWLDPKFSSSEKAIVAVGDMFDKPTPPVCQEAVDAIADYFAGSSLSEYTPEPPRVNIEKECGDSVEYLAKSFAGLCEEMKASNNLLRQILAAVKAE
jgi:hypothetical protein